MHLQLINTKTGVGLFQVAYPSWHMMAFVLVHVVTVRISLLGQRRSGIEPNKLTCVATTTNSFAFHCQCAGLPIPTLHIPALRGWGRHAVCIKTEFWRQKTTTVPIIRKPADIFVCGELCSVSYLKIENRLKASSKADATSVKVDLYVYRNVGCVKIFLTNDSSWTAMSDWRRAPFWHCQTEVALPRSI